jgi:hypothetical protein
MYPIKEREKDCPPITTFHLIINTPNSTNKRERAVRRMVSLGMRSKMKGSRFPKAY